MKRCRINNERLNLTGFQNLLGLGRNLLSIVLAIGLAACDNGLVGGMDDDETTTTQTPASGAIVGFRIQGGVPATYAYRTTVSSMDAFAVNGWVDDAGDNDPKLFVKKTVTKAPNTANGFTYEPPVFVPKEAQVATFVAYSPVSITMEDVDGQFIISADPNSNASDHIIGYRSPNPGAGEVQQDLLFAYTKVEGKADGEDADSGDDLYTKASAVVMNFKHALSRIHVIATNKASDPVVIKELSLTNIIVKAKFDLDGDHWGSNGAIDLNEDYIDPPADEYDYKTVWDILSGTETGTLKWQLAESGVAVPAGTLNPLAVTAEDQALLVIPQKTFVGLNDMLGFRLKVKYSLGNITAEKYFAYIEPNLHGFNSDYSCAFEMGKQYKMRLDFKQTAIGFSVAVEDWPVAIDVNN